VHGTNPKIASVLANHQPSQITATPNSTVAKVQSLPSVQRLLAAALGEFVEAGADVLAGVVDVGAAG